MWYILWNVIGYFQAGIRELVNNILSIIAGVLDDLFMSRCRGSNLLLEALIYEHWMIQQVPKYTPTFSFKNNFNGSVRNVLRGANQR